MLTMDAYTSLLTWAECIHFNTIPQNNISFPGFWLIWTVKCSKSITVVCVLAVKIHFLYGTFSDILSLLNSVCMYVCVILLLRNKVEWILQLWKEISSNRDRVLPQIHHVAKNDPEFLIIPDCTCHVLGLQVCTPSYFIPSWSGSTEPIFSLLLTWKLK